MQNITRDAGKRHVADEASSKQGVRRPERLRRGQSARLSSSVGRPHSTFLHNRINQSTNQSNINRLSEGHGEQQSAGVMRRWMWSGVGEASAWRGSSNQRGLLSHKAACVRGRVGARWGIANSSQSAMDGHGAARAPRQPETGAPALPPQPGSSLPAGEPARQRMRACTHLTPMHPPHTRHGVTTHLTVSARDLEGMCACTHLMRMHAPTSRCLQGTWRACRASW